MRLSAAGIGPPQVALIVATLGLGLAADRSLDAMGQLGLGLGFFAVMLILVARLPPRERLAMLACLGIATVAELCCSLAWGIYVYRLENVPLFVPPGHVLVFLLGIALARHLPGRTADAVLVGAGLYAVGAGLLGFDTFSVPLFLVIVVARLALPDHRRLYAATFLVALALELYGTGLGLWRWAPEVPGLQLTTINPPGVVGAFYCALDALVTMTVAALAGRGKAHPAATLEAS